MELQFLDYEFGDPKYSEEECRTKDLTFARRSTSASSSLDKERARSRSRRCSWGTSR